MARIVNFGGTQPPVPLGGDLIRSIQLSELLRQGRNRPPIQSVGQGFAQLGQDAIQAFTLAKLRQQDVAKEAAKAETIKNALAQKPNLDFSFIDNQPQQDISPTSERFAGQLPEKEFGSLPERLALANEMNQETRAASFDPSRPNQQAIDLALSSGPTRLAPSSLPDKFPALNRPSTTDERIQVLSQNPQTQSLALQLQLKADSDRQATAAQERQFKALSDRLALGQQFTAGENQKNRSSSEKIAANRLAGGSTTAQKNFALAQNDSDFKQFLADTGADNTPKSVKEFKFFRSLDEGSQEEFINLKRRSQTIDLGGAIIQPNPLNPLGEPGAVRPKTVPPQSRPSFKANVARETELGKIEGKTLGQAKADLPKVEASANQVIGLIDSLVSHPGLNGVVGVPSFSGVLHIPGTAEADFRERLNQIQGKQFLEAFQSIKGGGQITEVEGKKATQAIARMGTAQTEKSFIEAAKEFQGIVRKGIERAKTKAGITPKGGASGAIGGGEFNFNPETGKLERVERRKQ